MEEWRWDEDEVEDWLGARTYVCVYDNMNTICL